MKFSEMKVFKISTIKKYDKEMQNAIIDVDIKFFPEILAAEKLCIVGKGWERKGVKCLIA